MAEAKTEQVQAGASEVTQEQEASLLDQIITETRIGRDEVQREQSRRQIATLVEEVMQGTVRVSKDLESTINARIADIDELLSRQLNEIMHAPEFQKLEASWRGLHYLVHQSETSDTLKIRVLNATKRELFKDLDKAVEFDQSALFKRIYEEEYGQLGGEPYGMLVGDYEFTQHPEDVSLLKMVSNVAAAMKGAWAAAATLEIFSRSAMS